VGIAGSVDDPTCGNPPSRARIVTPSAVAIAVSPFIAVRFVEATAGVEPANSGFADRRDGARRA
jgi:hypothetical protein